MAATKRSAWAIGIQRSSSPHRTSVAAWMRGRASATSVARSRGEAPRERIAGKVPGRAAAARYSEMRSGVTRESSEDRRSEASTAALAGQVGEE
jgi:hypothetical protein